jgi:fucokinase
MRGVWHESAPYRMQPLGTHANVEYMSRVDHVASVTSVASPAAEAEAEAAAVHASPTGRLRRARELVAGALRGCPLLILPLVPSRFVHVGTMPELLLHTAGDPPVLAALPAAPAGVCLGTWDVVGMGGGGRSGCRV